MSASSVVVALALSHAVGLSQASYQRTTSGLDATITISRSEIEGAAGSTAMQQWIVERLTVEQCTLSESSQKDTAGEGVTISLRYTCPPDASAAIDARYIAELPSGHRQLVGNAVLLAAQSKFDPGQRPSPTFLSLVAMGVEHILSGWDHLLFLLGLVLVLTRRREVLGVVTAFTLAHSITLAVGALGVWSPSSRIVESVIAASIAYVGLENLLLRDRAARARWRVAFGFGLLHGFGFSSALAEVGSSVRELPMVLLGFNLGVELGQLAVLAVALPILAWARSSEPRWAKLRPALSAGLVVPGVVLCFARLVG
ncbi:MAG: HupE/UreJ family protein [Archangium sp.]